MGFCASDPFPLLPHSLAMAAAAPSGDVITLQSLSIDPSTPVAIDAPLRLTFVFDAARELPDAFWEFKVTDFAALQR
jgi:hypothetical protein